MKFKLVSEHRGSAVCHVLQDPLGGAEFWLHGGFDTPGIYTFSA